MMRARTRQPGDSRGPSLAVATSVFRSHDRELCVRLYTPSRTRCPGALLILFHGGGFVRGGVDAIAATARAMSTRLGLLVATPEYTLASVRPFPAAAEDAYAALVWANNEGRHRGWDARRIVVAGEEAGGNLAAAAAMMARDRGGPALAAQILVGPMLDPSLSSPSMQRFVASAVHTPGVCGACYRAYLPNAADRLHPYAAPASSTRLAGLAPALIVTCDGDPLRDEAEHYGGKLIAAGVTTQVSRQSPIATAAHCWTDDTWAVIDGFLRPRLAIPRGTPRP
jgi:acetyl esterase/lipase